MSGKHSAPADRLVSRRLLMFSGLAAVAASFSGNWLSRWLLGKPDEVASTATAVEGALELAEGEAIGFALAESDRPGLLIRTKAGLRAYERACPHLGCPVLWSQTTQRIECPCHAASFDAETGDVLTGPPPRGLTSLAVELRADRVLVSQKIRPA